MAELIEGRAFVVQDNIDTDQIIPAQHLSLVPTIPEEYKKLGSLALSGLPDSYPRLVPEGSATSPYTVVVAGRNFGCGSSREHAPISLGAAGVRMVVAESFARIFFRNCIATGELYPVESEIRLCETVQTDDRVVVDLAKGTLDVPARNIHCTLKPLGDAKDVIDKGGLFQFARSTGMIG